MSEPKKDIEKMIMTVFRLTDPKTAKEELAKIRNGPPNEEQVSTLNDLGIEKPSTWEKANDIISDVRQMLKEIQASQEKGEKLSYITSADEIEFEQESLEKSSVRDTINKKFESVEIDDSIITKVETALPWVDKFASNTEFHSALNWFSHARDLRDSLEVGEYTGFDSENILCTDCGHYAKEHDDEGYCLMEDCSCGDLGDWGPGFDG